MVLWGLGKEGLTYAKKLKKIDYIIDSNPTKAGTYFKNIKINYLIIFLAVDKKNYVFKICCISDAEIIKGKLYKLGFFKKKYFYSVAFKKIRKVVKNINKHINILNKIKIKDKEVIEFGFGGHLFFLYFQCARCKKSYNNKFRTYRNL